METEALNSLRGLAIGDAFGETFFFPDRAPVTPWPWTDDTAMALALVKTLRACGHVDQDALAVAFAEEYESDPHRNYGASMHDVLEAIGAGEPWSEVTRRQFGGQGSWGNGAAMRVAPLGAWFAGDLPTVIEQAALSAAVTHAHPEAAAGAIAVAVATSLNTTGRWTVPMVAAHVPPSAVRDGLALAATVPAGTSAPEAARLLGSGQRISAPDTVPFAVWCAATHPTDLVTALRFTASGGGDTDTTCAMTGGMVAARTGITAIPPDWTPEPLPAWVPPP